MKYILNNGKKYYLREEQLKQVEKNFMHEDMEFIVVKDSYKPEDKRFKSYGEFLTRETVKEVFEDNVLDTILLLAGEECCVWVQHDFYGYYESDKFFNRESYLKNGFDEDDTIIIQFNDGRTLKLKATEYIESEYTEKGE